MRITMGTFVAIEAAAASEAIASAAIEAAFAAVTDVEQRMHPTRAGSDVARINAAPRGGRTPIHTSTLEVLRLARLLHELTDGVFDPCLPGRPGRLADLELLPSSEGEARAWVIPRAPLALDLGGIAKGYAVDCAVRALREGGCHAGGVNAGGDLRLFGDRLETTVLVRYADGSAEPVVLREGAIAVSDFDEMRRPPEHRGYYRRSSIRSGGAARGDPAGAVRRHAAVIAADAMSADALTKCVLLCAKNPARRALASLGGRVLS